MYVFMYFNILYQASVSNDNRFLDQIKFTYLSFSHKVDAKVVLKLAPKIILS